MKRRVAKFSHETLTKMWSSNHTRWMVVEYMTKRVVGTLEILDKLDLTGRTAELAKLFGIQFLEVLSRGSQFRVESIMLRLVRAKNLVPVSPTIQVRTHWNVLLDLFIHRFYPQNGICIQKYNFWPKNDGEKWSRKIYFEIPPCGKIVILLLKLWFWAFLWSKGK